MIGRFLSERGETTKQNFSVVVANGGCTMDCELPRCLMSRNIHSKRDGKRDKTEAEKLPKEVLAKNVPRVTAALDIIRNSAGKSFDRSEILIEGTALNCQNLFQNTNDAKITHHVQTGLEEHTASSCKDDGKANENAMNTERSLINSPEMSLNTLDDRTAQDNENEVSLLGSPKAMHRSLNPSPWKEVWSALQDRSLATCLSTKSMEFGRDIPETSFSTRTNPYSKQRREKPQRIPRLYNKRKTVPTTRDYKTEIPSFDEAVIFNTVIRDIRRNQHIGIIDDIGKCKECTNLMESVQIESDEGHRCGKHESKGIKDKTIGLPQITCPPSVRYKSKFRVRLLPLVAKSDSLPNLTSTSTLAPSELIVTAPMNVACSNENVGVDCPKDDDSSTNLVTEPVKLMNKCRQSRSMSLDSVFQVESLAAYQAKKSISKGINVQGFQVLPDIKQIEPKKYQPTLMQNDADISGISQTPVMTLPWKCN